MTSSMVSDHVRRPSAVLSAMPFRPRRYRRRRSSALLLGRLRRGARRQWRRMLAIALVVAGLGIAFSATTGVLSPGVAASWLATGAAFSFGVGFFLELGRNTVTSLSSLGKHRGYAVLGAAPYLPPRALRELPPDQRTPLGCLAFQPASAFATAFRDLQGALTGDQVVAFIGSLPNEGASTTALCAAVSAAQQGRRVILIDCDLRRRSFTAALEQEPDVGVLEACEHPTEWRDYVDEEVETGLHFLPAARSANAWSSLVGSPGFQILLNQLRGAYDLIILDCPPALRSAEGPVIASMADKCVLVAAWDETPLSALRAAMRRLRGPRRANTGVYVNRVPQGYRFGRLRPD